MPARGALRSGSDFIDLESLLLAMIDHAFGEILAQRLTGSTIQLLR
jgi:hypothetical protein